MTPGIQSGNTVGKNVVDYTLQLMAGARVDAQVRRNE